MKGVMLWLQMMCCVCPASAVAVVTVVAAAAAGGGSCMKMLWLAQLLGCMRTVRMSEFCCPVEELLSDVNEGSEIC